MKHFFSILTVALAATFTFSLPLAASAHEHRVYRIGGEVYEFTVGSLNEPIAVDDKTGVDVRVMRLPGGAGGHGEGVPVEGLDAALQVEIGAGGKSKVMALEAQYGVPGGYRAVFIPTVQTTYTYRFFGEIDGTPVDLEFSCNPAGHPVTEQEGERELSTGVTQLEKTGAYGCPVAKADLGFPEPSSSVYDLQNKDEELGAAAAGASLWGMIGIALGALGLAAGAGAWMKKK